MFNSKQLEVFSALYMKYNNRAFTSKNPVKEQYNLGKRDMIADIVAIFNSEDDVKKLWNKELMIERENDESRYI